MSVKEIFLPFDVGRLPARQLKAGKLSCLYEFGNLRYIKWGNTEIVRMIYSAVRDENWETIPAVISNETIDENENGVVIGYSADYASDKVRYRSTFSIMANKEGAIIFSMNGEALCDFKKNRIGLCLHHPIKECAGQEVFITQPDAATYHASFPEQINPHQPFLNVKKMEWSIEGLQVTIQFEGEIFETEDHRNWADSSYKTYGTPLTLPFPAWIATAEKTEQRIIIHIIEKQARQARPELFTREEKIPFPRIGYCRPERKNMISDAEIGLLQQVPFDHYRVELRVNDTSWHEKLWLAAKEAQLLNTKLELIVFFPENYQTAADDLVLHLGPVKGIISSILVLQENKKTTPFALLDDIYKIIKRKYPLIKVGYGTDAYFAELNRNKPLQAGYDFVSFSMNPQVHATDTRTLLENLENLSDMIETAKSFTDKEIHVSPVTLKKRGNPDATTKISDTGTVADDRQHSSFAAYWTLMCIQNLAGAGQITFYEISGEAGILKNSNPSPVYEVLKMLKDFRAAWIARKYRNNALVVEDFTVANTTGDLLVFKTSL